MRHCSLVSAACLIALAVLCGCANGGNVTRTEVNLLGTVCTVTLYGGGTEADLDAAFRRIGEIEDNMTVDRKDSEVIRVNEAAGLRPSKVSADTFAVIKEGLEVSRLGDGAFDITVGPLVKLWGIGTERAHIPAESEIRKALAFIDYRAVSLDPARETVELKKKGMAMDLGAIAKGYAADEAARVLASRGVRHALIDLGGNILTLGRKPDGSVWRIGIQDPEEPRGNYLGIIEVPQMSVVTSGVYERYFIKEGIRYHHILDTKSGYPVRNGLLAVSIVALPSMVADGYSTLVFTLGLEKGRKLVEKSGGAVNAVFVTDAHKVYVTPGIKGIFRLTSSRFTLAGW